LKPIASIALRKASVDFEAARERGIAVVNTGYDSTRTIELTWALILASARHVVAESTSFRSGGWQREIGTDLKGKTLGVLGLGNFGAEVARIGHAFGMRPIAWSENLTAERAAAGAEHVSELFRQSGVLTIHLVFGRRSTQPAWEQAPQSIARIGCCVSPQPVIKPLKTCCFRRFLLPEFWPEISLMEASWKRQEESRSVNRPRRRRRSLDAARPDQEGRLD